MNEIYSIENLECLKNCFYTNLSDGDEKLNIGLNVFFGNKPNNDDEWKKSFKERIIQLTEKRLESEKVSISRSEISKQNLDNIKPEEIIFQGRKKWLEIQDMLNTFLENLKKKLGEDTLKQTLIYEAPPYKITYSIDNKSTEFVASFIFENNCSSAYAQSIKDWVGNKNNPSDNNKQMN